MSEDINYKKDWTDESTQCHNCRSFKTENGVNACVPEGDSFAEAVEKYGQVDANGHCNYFEAAE